MAAAELLAPYGVDLVGLPARGGTEAAAAAASIGWPVVVKVSDPEVPAKSDRGLVRVGLGSTAAVLSALDDFAAELDVAPDDLDVRVQPVVTGVELAVSVLRDDTYGPVVRVAAGGVAGDLLHDEVHLLAPSRRQTPPAPSAACAPGRCSTAYTDSSGSTSTPSRPSSSPPGSSPPTYPSSPTST